MSSRKKILVWLDLEMTGLDPKKERIIEMATIVTDSDLNILAEGPNIVINQSKKLLKKMDDWNQKQHKKSGLLDLVKTSRISEKKAEKETLEFLKTYCEPQKSPLCGNSIHHDRKFLAAYMPKLNEFLHYRHIDVSTLKALSQWWYAKLKQPKKKECHRALDDIRESIEELKFYREHIFKPA